MLLVREALRQLLDHRIERQGLVDERGQLDEPAHEIVLALRIRAVMLGERHDQHAECSELRRERLGRGHADLGTRARQHDELRLAHDRAFRHVADAERREVPGCLARRSAASVSAVSPDCEMVTNSESGITTGLR